MTSIAPITVSDEYAAAIDYLYGRINYEQSPPIQYQPRKINLDNMRLLLDRLGNPHLQIPVIHVAGTKGKGSTAVMTSSVLTAAGYRTGLYTSPHLSRLEERYMVDGVSCSPSELISLVSAVRPAVSAVDDETRSDSLPAPLTFFEITTAMVWLHFVRHKIDIAVLEVGMGGRLDSTNLCRPLLSVITSISFDHTKQLGNTLAAITNEKAGIIKPGVAVVTGVQQAEAKQVILNRAQHRRCDVYALGCDFDVECHPRSNPPSLDYRERIDGIDRHLSGVRIGLLGQHQARNAAVALAALGRLERTGWKVNEDSMRRGMAAARCPARIEVIRRNPTVILDTAHNVASAQALIDTLNEHFPGGRRILLFSVSRDKDVRGMLRILLPEFDRVILTQFVANPRSVAPEELDAITVQIQQEFPAAKRAEIELSSTPIDAWRACRSALPTADLACITGSFFLAAEMRSILTSNSAEEVGL